jgi:hypothetical protein
MSIVDAGVFSTHWSRLLAELQRQGYTDTQIRKAFPAFAREWNRGARLGLGIWIILEALTPSWWARLMGRRKR